MQVVSEDGSPHGPKCFVLWNPPLTKSMKKKAKRRSAAALADDPGAQSAAGILGIDNGARGGIKISKYVAYDMLMLKCTRNKP